MKIHALLFTTGLLLSATALADAGQNHAHDHDHAHTASAAHDHAPRHGGVVSESNDMDFELVVQTDRIRLYLRDHGQPASIEGASAKLTLLGGNGKQSVELQPAGDHLAATGSFAAAPGTKVVARVQRKGKLMAVRFVLP